MTALTAEQWRTKYRKEVSRLQSKLNNCETKQTELEEIIEQQKAGLVEALAMLDYYLTDDNRAAWGLASKTTRNAFREQVNDEWVRDIIDAGVEVQDEQ